MPNNNKHNLLYFEASTMRNLYEKMNNWQQENQKRLLSTNIQREDEHFSCIALSNPTEVVIVDSQGRNSVKVIGNCLQVFDSGHGCS